MRNPTHVAVILVAIALAMPASAQKPSAYPANGQDVQQQGQDDAECLAWARQSTGIDPAVAAAQPAPTGPQGERLRGAARGAVVGEVVADDAGAGAAVGAVAGGRRARINKAAGAQQAQAANAQSIDTYYRAYGACMQGRGYTVK
ncbi:hypothetical protein ACFPOA_10225 [Lysobacter niabensis]|uniref:hypothetical protein n=1 Tax=Agrilutibacter niabensis TaxID=380628 RepID=UPI003607FEF1